VKEREQQLEMCNGEKERERDGEKEREREREMVREGERERW